MVENPDLSIEGCFLQGRPQVECHENHLVLLGPEGSGKVTVLVRIYFIVDRDRSNFHSRVGVSLEKLDEILSVSGKPTFLNATSQHGATTLHPSGRAPHAREEVEVWIDFLRFSQGRNDPGPILVNAEIFQLWIRFRPVIIAVHLGGIITGSDTRPS